MHTLPAGAPAQAGGAAAVSESLTATVLHDATLVVLTAGYPVGIPPSVICWTWPESGAGRSRRLPRTRPNT